MALKKIFRHPLTAMDPEGEPGKLFEILFGITNRFAQGGVGVSFYTLLRRFCSKIGTLRHSANR